MKLSIIIPVYNEKNTLAEILERVEEVSLPNIEKEIIVIDDGSSDGSSEILKDRQDRCRVVYEPENRGKGAAIREGLKLASGEITLIQDADLEYNPKDYLLLLEPILEKKADVVFGSRFISPAPHRVLYFWHYLANKFLTTLSNMFTNLNLSDVYAGYKVFNRKAVHLLKNQLTAKGFNIEPEFASLVARNKLRLYEVGISYSGRTYEEGKKINWKDGLAAIFWIIKYGLF